MKVKRSPKKGRGKRPGFPQGVAAEASISTPCGQYVWNGGPFQAGWVPHTDSDGYRYYWNEALQEYRCDLFFFRSEEICQGKRFIALCS